MLTWASVVLEAKKSRWLAEADPLASEHLVAQSEALLKRTDRRKGHPPIAKGSNYHMPLREGNVRGDKR